MSTNDSSIPSGTPTPNRATRRAQGQRSSRGRKLGAIGSGAVLASGAAAAVLGATAGPADAATTFTVTETTDDGTVATVGSLSWAIDQANNTAGEDIIDFAVATVTMAAGPGQLPGVTEAVDITGPGASALTLDLTGHCGIYLDNVDAGTPTISGLTITHGATGAQNTCNDDDSGGAIALFYGDTDVVIDSVVLTENYAYNDGGAIVCYLGDGALTITNSTIDHNEAQESGGGLYADCNGALTITNSTFAYNDAGSIGGGLYALGAGNTTISGSTIDHNNADAGSGGVDASIGGQLTIANSTLSANTGGGYGGGGLAAAADATTILQSTIAGNRSEAITGAPVDLAGGVSIGSGDLVVTQSTISGNTSTGSNGGLYLNKKGAGNLGAAAAKAGEAGEEGPEKAAKRAAKQAAREDVGAQDTDRVDLVGTIISGNTADAPAGTTDIGADGDNGPVIVHSDHSLFGIVDAIDVSLVDAGGTQTGVTNPGLGTLANNGGPTQTMALLAGSPALNTGPSAGTVGATTAAVNALAVPAVGPYDQRGKGFPRISGGLIDIGAYEFQVIPRFTG